MTLLFPRRVFFSFLCSLIVTDDFAHVCVCVCVCVSVCVGHFCGGPTLPSSSRVSPCAAVSTFFFHFWRDCSNVKDRSGPTNNNNNNNNNIKNNSNSFFHLWISFVSFRDVFFLIFCFNGSHFSPSVCVRVCVLVGVRSTPFLLFLLSFRENEAGVWRRFVLPLRRGET